MVCESQYSDMERVRPIRAADARLQAHRAREARKPDLRPFLRAAYAKVREAADRGENAARDVFSAHPVWDEGIKSALADALTSDGYHVEIERRKNVKNPNHIFNLEW